MKAPFSWPNNSEAIRSRGIAAQFTLTNGRAERPDRRWMARATSSLPVPVSPVIRTVESLGATLEMRESTVCKAGEFPTISSNIDFVIISSRSAMFSFRIPSSACLRSSMSVAVPYHRVMCPCSSLTGFRRIRKWRNSPSCLSKRASNSYGAP